jgi:hypothetical protein
LQFVVSANGITAWARPILGLVSDTKCAQKSVSSANFGFLAAVIIAEQLRVPVSKEIEGLVQLIPEF